MDSAKKAIVSCLLSSSTVVGDTRFELVTSTLSIRYRGKLALHNLILLMVLGLTKSENSQFSRVSARNWHDVSMTSDSVFRMYLSKYKKDGYEG